VSTAGVGGFGMMPMPMPMGGVARAGLLGDSPSIPVPTKSEKDEEVTAEAESTEAAEVVQSSETPEAEVPTMTVLPTAAPGIAAQAAPGEARPAAQPAASGIPVSGLRAAASSQAKDASEASDEPAEAEEAVATLRPQIAPGEFHPRTVEEEAPKVQIRGA
jgi:hypothetical protein